MVRWFFTYTTNSSLLNAKFSSFNWIKLSFNAAFSASLLVIFGSMESFMFGSKSPFADWKNPFFESIPGIDQVIQNIADTTLTPLEELELKLNYLNINNNE